MAKDPTQGPVSTHDAEGNPIMANVDAPIEEVAVEEAEEETAADESDVEETEEEVAEAVATPPDLPENYEGGTEPVEPVVEETEEEISVEEDASEESEPETISEPYIGDDRLWPDGSIGPETVVTDEISEVEGEDESSEDGIAPTEDLWDRLTEVGAYSDQGGVVRNVEFTCDRCGETKQGKLLPEGTAGFYPTDEELGWAKYANEDEEILCDACMQSDERYLADYPLVDSSVEETDEVEEDAPVEEEEEFVTHEHEVRPPLTYNEAETMLMESSFLDMREMAIADGIKPERTRVKLTRQLLDYWFPAPASRPEDEPEMSVRIRRAKGLM